MNSQTILDLQAGTLILLSGPPGSGKSTFLVRAHLPDGFVVCPDVLRRQFLGVQRHWQDGRRVERLSEEANVEVWATVRAIVGVRMKQRLTTVVDAMLLTDEDRRGLIELARAHGAPAEVWIADVDLQTCQQANAERPRRLPATVIEKAFSTFETTSRFPSRRVDFRTAGVRLTPMLEISDPRTFVIGDVHGLWDDLQALLMSIGFVFDTTGLAHHPEGYRLLFLGDLVDRGTQSVEVLQFVQRMHQAGRADALLGNHEAKLLRFWDAVKDGSLESWTSVANAETGMALLRLPANQADKLVEFLRQLPVHALHRGADRVVGFVHADVDLFDPFTMPAAEALYGASRFAKLDTDALLQSHLEGRRRAQPDEARMLVVRGHIERTSLQPDVLVLEERQAYGGHLCAWDLAAWLRDPCAPAASAVHRHRCTFDYDTYRQNRYRLGSAMDSLVNRKLATVATQTGTGLRLFKYAPKVHFDGLWDSDKNLLRARGLVLDAAGNIVANPFTKVFNAGEETLRYGGRMPSVDETVIAVDKLNGFLGCISPHPVRKGELLVTTTGSFDSPFVGYIRHFVDGALKGRLLKHFHTSGPLTLMFEVIHPEDPHIIEYDASMQGLHLIGARALAPDAAELTEEALDALAAVLQLRRAHWRRIRYGELVARLAEERVEGYMVREDTPAQLTLTKLKGPYYLVTKLLARMSEGKWKHLYANPKDFRKRIDEEFYSLLDAITRRHAVEEVLAMSEEDKKSMVRGLVRELSM